MPDRSWRRPSSPLCRASWRGGLLRAQIARPSWSPLRVSLLSFGFKVCWPELRTRGHPCIALVLHGRRMKHSLSRASIFALSSMAFSFKPRSRACFWKTDRVGPGLLLQSVGDVNILLIAGQPALVGRWSCGLVLDRSTALDNKTTFRWLVSLALHGRVDEADASSSP